MTTVGGLTLSKTLREPSHFDARGGYARGSSRIPVDRGGKGEVRVMTA